jgi:hypothetical protein
MLKLIDPFNMAIVEPIDAGSWFIWLPCFFLHLLHAVFYGLMDLDDLESFAGMAGTK